MGTLYGNNYFFATSFSQSGDIYVPLCREFPTFSCHIVQIDVGSNALPTLHCGVIKRGFFQKINKPGIVFLPMENRLAPSPPVHNVIPPCPPSRAAQARQAGHSDIAFSVAWTGHITTTFNNMSHE